MTGHQAAVTAVAVTPDGDLLASGSADGTIRLWSLPEGDPVKTLEGNARSITALAISPDGSLLAAGDASGMIEVWLLPSGTYTAGLMDLEANKADVEGTTYTGTTAGGHTGQYTRPCGAPSPAGAVCVCNCVAGSVPTCSCVGHRSCSCVGAGHYWYPC